MRTHSREKYPQCLLWNWLGASWFPKLNLFSDFIYTQLCHTAWESQTWSSLLWRHRRIWHLITLNSGNKECTLLPFAQHKWSYQLLKSIGTTQGHKIFGNLLPISKQQLICFHMVHWESNTKNCLTLNRKTCLLGLFGIVWLFCQASQPR